MRTKRRMQPASQLIKAALIHHQEGRLDEAAKLYKRILLQDPEHADALHYSGLIAHQTGDSDAAITMIRRAIRREPRNSTYLYNLGFIFENQGELDHAVASYREALALDSNLAAAHCKLGNVLLSQGQIAEAVVSLTRALNLKPDFFEAANCLGSALQRSGRTKQAEVCYRKAISLNPRYSPAYNNLGNVLLERGQFDEGMDSYRQALVYQPDFAEVHHNLGKFLGEQGDTAAAIEHCQKAIEIRPDYADAYMVLGNCYLQSGQLRAAACSFQRAISIVPDHFGAYNNMAAVLKEQGEVEAAAQALKNALAIRPNYGIAYSNLLYLYALTRGISLEAERLLAEGWEKQMLTAGERADACERARTGFPFRPRTARKLRIGIVSADLGNHAVAEFLEPLLEQLDRRRFHLTLFPTIKRVGVRAEHFRELADDFIPFMDVTDEDAAEQVRFQEIDVLIDATAHTVGGRLGIFARRAAPVQCTYLGYWGTTGLTEMDWYLSDVYNNSSLDAHFSEGMWRLPRLAYTYRGDGSLPESGWTPDPDGTIWVGSFNKFEKIREETLSLWAKVLHALPEAKLLLEDRTAHDEEPHQRICRILADQGIAEDRIEFIPYVPGHERHMAMYDRLDIALDTIPFNSGTTAFDALWMGVPLVALEGNWLGGVIASSVLKAFDHLDWIARDDDEYVSIVCSLARDVEGRKTLRHGQRARMAASPLCDAKGLARSLEDAFEEMYDGWMERSSGMVSRDDACPLALVAGNRGVHSGDDVQPRL